MSKNKPRKARLLIPVLYAATLNGLWAGFNSLIWQASTMFEVNKSFMVWLVLVGSIFVFAASTLFIVMGVTNLMSDEEVVGSALDEFDDDAPMTLSVTVNQVPQSASSGVFALGFVAGSAVTALLSRLLRKSR